MPRAPLCLVQPPLQWRCYLALLKACLPGRVHIIIRHGMNILFDVYASLLRIANRYACSNVTFNRERHCVVEAARRRNISWMHWLSVHL